MNIEIKEKLERLAELERKEKKAKEYNKSYYRNWKMRYDEMVRFYGKWFGKEVKGVKLT